MRYISTKELSPSRPVPTHYPDEPEKELAGMGATVPMDDVMVQYWLKMAAAVYTLMGCFFVIVAIRPIKYRLVIKLIGLLHVFLGAVFLTNGLMLGVEAIPLYVDVGFCLCVGVGILAINRRLPT